MCPHKNIYKNIHTSLYVISSGQLFSRVQLPVTPWTQSPIPEAHSNSCPSSQWCHPTISSSVIPFNLSQHPVLFKWISSLHQVAKVLEFQFNISPSNEDSGLISLGCTGWISLQSMGLSRVFNTVQKHQFFSTQHSL